MRSSFRILARIVAIAGLLAVSSTLFRPPFIADAIAQGASLPKDGNTLVCRALAQNITQQPGELDSRQLNFFLFDAAQKGCGAVAVGLLDQGASLAARDRFANTALVLAAANGHSDLVAYFLDKGAALDHANLNGSTALLRAAISNERKMVKLLLDRGATVIVQNRAGATPLAAAAFNGNRRLVKMLIAAGADPAQPDGTGKPPIIYAAAKGHAKIVKTFLAAGVAADIRDKNDLTALMWSAGHPNDVPQAEALATIDILLAAKATLDLADNRGRTALMIAAGRGHRQIVEALLKAGADPELMDRDGYGAWELAASDEIKALFAR
ncbi:MAG: ankyrin repeat domain-containing protein [Alphaproteobacteria bacterium]|nr:MAG: ankyrin repeat domain-containing protein [Alphaproteobacteria bacterium]